MRCDCILIIIKMDNEKKKKLRKLHKIVAKEEKPHQMCRHIGSGEIFQVFYFEKKKQ